MQHRTHLLAGFDSPFFLRLHLQISLAAAVAAGHKSRNYESSLKPIYWIRPIWWTWRLPTKCTRAHAAV